MKKRKNLLFLSFIRGLALIIFFLVLFLIGYFLWFSGGRKIFTRSAPPAMKPESSKMEQQIGIKAIGFRGDQGRIEVRAERHTALEEGRYRLEGQVEIHDFGRRPELESWLRCEEAIYNQDWNKVLFLGQVKLKRQGLELEADKVSYLREAEFFEAEGSVKLRIKRLSGEAENLHYFLKEDKLHLIKGIKLKWIPAEPDKSPYWLQSESFVYDRLQRRGRVEGNVRFGHSQSSGEAGWVEFLLSEDEQYLRQLNLGGGLKGGVQSESFDSSLSASLMKVRPFFNSSRIHALQAEGNSQLQLTRSDEVTSFAAEKLEIVFDRWGGLREIKSEEKAQWRRKNLETGEEQEARGEKINYYAGKGHLVINSPVEKKTYLTSQRVRIIAAEMTLNVDTQDLEALGDVEIILSPKKSGSIKATGFISGDKPIFSHCQEFFYFMKSGQLTLNRESRLWQEDFSLRAARISLEEETKTLEAANEVKMVIVRRGKKDETRLQAAQIMASKLNYFPTESKLNFIGPCQLHSADLRVSSNEMIVYLKKDSSEVERIEAQGEIKLTKGLSRASAERGIYEWEKEVLVLVGRPILEDPEQGTIRGDKLTFNLTEGRIIVENQGRERSLSIIKKEK